MRFLLGNNEIGHVSSQVVAELENAALKDERVRGVRPTSPILHTAGLNFYKAVRKINRLTGMKVMASIPGGRRDNRSRDYFAVMTGPEMSSLGQTATKCFPYFLLPARKSLYIFDAWPNAVEGIGSFVDICEVKYLFVSSSQAAENIRKIVEACHVYWIPEGVDPSLYSRRPFAERNIDVLQLGRKFDAYHQCIVKPLEQLGKVYRYEKTRGEVIFPTRAGFVDGLAHAKISICVPSNITHPERSGETETMTTRYLQSMVSKCLVLGSAPKEMVKLFGYNPVVDIDMNDPAGQIGSLLDNLSKYEPLIERNYEAVLSQHTWTNRWKSIAEILWPHE